MLWAVIKLIASVKTHSSFKKASRMYARGLYNYDDDFELATGNSSPGSGHHREGRNSNYVGVFVHQ